MSTATIELSSSRQKLFEALGDSQQAYIDHMKTWFRKKSSKEEFDVAARKLLSKDVIHLHNQFLLAILNKCQTLVNLTPGPSLVKPEITNITINQELLSPSKFDPSADRLKKGKIKRKVKPNKAQLEHKFQPVATSLCAPRSPRSTCRRRSATSPSASGRRRCPTSRSSTGGCWWPPGRRGWRGSRTRPCRSPWPPWSRSCGDWWQGRTMML